MAGARRALVLAVLAVWQWAPQIPGITKWAPIFDPFFIGRVKAAYEIRIPRPRDVIKVKDSEEYLEDFREIWRILGAEFA